MLGLFHAQLEPKRLRQLFTYPTSVNGPEKGHQPPSGPPSPRVGSTFSKILLGLEEFARAKRGFLAYDNR
jgi:hypothetical protein